MSSCALGIFAVFAALLAISTHAQGADEVGYPSMIVEFLPTAPDAFNAYVFTDSDAATDPGVGQFLDSLGFVRGRALWRGSYAAVRNVYFLEFDGVLARADLLTGLQARPEIMHVTEDAPSQTLYPSDAHVVRPADHYYNVDFELYNYATGVREGTCESLSQELRDEFGSYRQWPLPRLGLERAWAITTGDSTNVVAVLDSGVDWRHPDLAPLIARNGAEQATPVPGETGPAGDGLDNDGNGYIDDVVGWDFADIDNEPNHDPQWWEDFECADEWTPPCNSTVFKSDVNPGWGRTRHGTQMASIISAVTSETAGVTDPIGDIAAINWKTKILPLKIGPKTDPWGHRRLVDLELSITNEITIWRDPDVVDFIVGGGTIVTDEQRTTGDGAPGAQGYRRFRMDVGASAGDMTFRGYLSETRIFDPAGRGTLSHIRFAASLRTIAVGPVRTGLLIRQGGNYYAAFVPASAPADWTESVILEAVPGDFVPMPGSSGIPDFSANGAPIALGFVVGRYRSDDPLTSTVEFDLDNLEVWANPWYPIDASPPGALAAAIEAMNYIVDLKVRGAMDIRVLSMSLTFDNEGDLYRDFDIFQDRLFPVLRANGILPVGGSGNWGNCDDPIEQQYCETPIYPCRDPNVLCATAVDYYGEKLTYAQVGVEGADNRGKPYSGVDVAAYATYGEGEGGCGVASECDPGVLPVPMVLAYEPVFPAPWNFCNVDSPVPFPEHIAGTSPYKTSGATAQTAAIAALIMGAYPDLEIDQVVAMIKRGAINIDAENESRFNGMFGAGRLDAYRSLTLWGAVARDTTLSGDVYVSGDVLIASGVTVTVAPGARIHIAPDDNEGTGSVDITVYGQLVSAGTAAEPVTFSGWSPTPTTDTWSGLVFPYGSQGGSFDHTTIRHAQTAVRISTPTGLSVTNVEIEECVYGVEVTAAGVATLGPNLTIEGASIGILQNGTTTLTDVSILDSYVGMYSIESTTFQSPASVIDGCVLSGLYVSATAPMTVEHLEVRNASDTGIYLYGTAANVGAGVLVEDCGTGIRAALCSPDVTGVVLTGNGVGVMAEESGSLRLRQSTINQGVGGIACYDSATIDAGTTSSYGDNSFDGLSGFFGVNGNVDAPLEMVGNCYSGKTTPKAGRFLGSYPDGPVNFLPGDCN